MRLWLAMLLLCCLMHVGTGEGEPCSGQCNILSWNAWDACSNSCGPGTRKRTRDLCCSTHHVSFDHCAADCGITDYSQFDDTGSCYGCENGQEGGTSGCSCTHGYTGSCCQARIPCDIDAPVSGSVKLEFEEAIYSCDRGFEMEGDATRTCSNNGTWTGAEHSCSLKCSVPDAPMSGSVEQESANAIYSCDSGFELEGDATRTCSYDGTWTGAEPACISGSAGVYGWSVMLLMLGSCWLSLQV